MSTPFDALLDRITMYRLVLYVLIGEVGFGVLFASLGLLHFGPLALVGTAALFVALCWAANTILAQIFRIPANIESAYITGLILTLIFDPAKTGGDVTTIGWIAIVAMASKFLLALQKKHVFNPAAIAAVIAALALKDQASWWPATISMLPIVTLGGLMIARKLRQETMLLAFLVTATTVTIFVSLFKGLGIGQEIRALIVDSPLIFFASIMLTEPLSAPPTAGLRNLYGALVGVLFVPQLHIGSVYSTPELALVLGNIYAFLVSSKQRVTLRLKRKQRVGTDIVDFVFTPSQRLAFAPGQYMEFTLDHPGPDDRGNRRYFTLASAPTEESVHLGVKFAPEGSSFKRALYTLEPKTRLYGAQIGGDFTLPTDRQKKLAFIAGGIGITPFRSMLKYLLDSGEVRDIVVLYANRTASEITYRDVLNEAQARLGIPIHYALTDTAAIPANWPGLRGRVDGALIAAVIPDYQDRIFYVSGPPALVRDAERELRRLGLRRDAIKKDDFPGLA